MDCSPLGLSVHGIFQARILEWGAISFSRVSSQPRNRTCVSDIGRQILDHWATREAPKMWTGLLQYRDKTNRWGFALCGWANKVVSWDGIYFWWRGCEHYRNNNKKKDLEYYINLVDETAARVKTDFNFEGTALHVTEILVTKGSVNQCSKLHSYLILRNCYSHLNFQQPRPWLVSSHPHQGKILTSKTIITLWRPRWWLASFSNQVFFN